MLLQLNLSMRAAKQKNKTSSYYEIKDTNYVTTHVHYVNSKEVNEGYSLKLVAWLWARLLYTWSYNLILHVYDDFPLATLRFEFKKDDGKNHRIFFIKSDYHRLRREVSISFCGKLDSIEENLPFSWREMTIKMSHTDKNRQEGTSSRPPRPQTSLLIPVNRKHQINSTEMNYYVNVLF